MDGGEVGAEAAAGQGAHVLSAGGHEDEPHRVERAQRELSGPKNPNGKALGTLAVLAVAYTLYFAAAILLPFVLAIVLYLLLSPVMRVLTKRLHLPRFLAALMLIVLRLRRGGRDRGGNLGAGQRVGRQGAAGAA